MKRCPASPLLCERVRALRVGPRVPGILAGTQPWSLVVAAAVAELVNIVPRAVSLWQLNAFQGLEEHLSGAWLSQDKNEFSFSRSTERVFKSGLKWERNEKNLQPHPQRRTAESNRFVTGCLKVVSWPRVSCAVWE